MAAEKNEMTEEAQRIITTIKQMEASLDDNKAHHQYEAEEEGMKVTFPLMRCLQGLKEKHLQISKLHRERFEQVKSMPKNVSQTTQLLTTQRTCSSIGILFITPRKFICQDHITTDVEQFAYFPHLRFVSHIRRSARR